MILVIGGAYQGKLKLVFSWLGKEIDRSFYADGASDSWLEINNKPVIYRVQDYLKRGMEEHRDMDDWVRQLLEANPDYVIMDEVGYGVVPVIKELRLYRELAGRTGQQLALKAEAVYRVVCGIPTQIK